MRAGSLARFRGKAATGEGFAAWPWWLSATVAGGGIALAGALVSCAVVVVIWLSDTEHSLWEALQVGTQLWFLAHGVPVDVGGVSVSVMPLGLSLPVCLAIGAGASRAAAARRQSRPQRPVQTVLGEVTAVVCASYALTAVIIGVLATTPLQVLQAGAATAAVSALSALLGAVKGAGLRPWMLASRWPWAPGTLRGAAATTALVLASGAAAVVVALISGMGRVVTMSVRIGAGDDPGLTLAELAFLPTFIVWGAAYVVGGGVTLGMDSLVSLTRTSLGWQPAVPLLAAAPSTASPGHMLWLLLPGAAAAVGAWLAVRRLHPLTIERGGIWGAASGLVAAFCLLLVGAISRGSLGQARMTGFGPRLLEMFVMSAALLGLAGMATGIVCALTNRRRATAAAEDSADG